MPVIPAYTVKTDRPDGALIYRVVRITGSDTRTITEYTEPGAADTAARALNSVAVHED